MMQYILPANLALFLKPFVQDPSQMDTIVTKIQEALLDQNTLSKKKFVTKTAYTLDLNFGRYYHRVVFEKAIVDGVKYYVLRGFAWVHDYNLALKWQPLGHVTTDDVRNLYRSEIVKIDCLSEESNTSVNMVYFNTNWYEPTALHTEILAYKQFPQLVVGPPGSGKSFIAMALLQEQALQHIQNNQPGVLKLLYLCGAPRVIAQAKNTWRTWEKLNLPPGNNRVMVSFLTVEEFNSWYTETCKFYSLSEEERLNQISAYFPTGFDCKKILVELYNNAWRLTQDAEKNKQWFLSFYKESGARHSLYDEEERASLYSQFLMIIQDLQKKVFINDRTQKQQRFFPGVSVVTPDDALSLYDLAIVDEIQNTPVQSLLGIYRFSKNGQTVFIGDSLQKGQHIFSTLPELEPAVYTLFNQKLHVLTLSKTLRLIPGVAKVANDIVQLFTNLNQGRADLLSYTMIEAPGDNPSPKQKCVFRVTNTEKESLTLIGSDPHAAVVVLSEVDKEQACRLINGSNVFTHDEAQGIDFSQVLVYLSEHTLMRFIAVAKRMTEQGLTPESELMNYQHQSAEKGNVGQPIFEVLSNLLVGISRSYGPLWVYWDPLTPPVQHKLYPFLPWLGQTLGEETKPSAAPITDIKPDDWLNRIHRFIEEGAITQARGNLCQIFSLNQQEAESYIALCQNGQSKSSSNELMSWVMSTRLPAETVAKIIQTAVSEVPTRTPAVTPLIPEKVLSTRVVTPFAEISMAFTPLSEKLSEWVEELYLKMNNLNNVKALLSHAKALQILFHHPMSTNHCLWINLALSNQLGTFLDHTKQYTEKVISLIKMGFEIAKQEQNTLLMFSFSAEEERLTRLFPNLSIRATQWLTQEKLNQIPSILGEPTCKIHSSLLMYITQSKYFSVQHMPFLTYQTLNEEGKTIPSILHMLIAFNYDFSNVSSKLLREITNYFAPVFSVVPEGKKHTLIWQMVSAVDIKKDQVAFLIEILNYLSIAHRVQILFNTTAERIGKIELSMFNFLFTKVHNLSDTSKHWTYLSKFIANNLPLFFEQEWADTGTHFHALCSNFKGNVILSDCWSFFAPIIEKNPIYLFMPITANGKNKGKTPFYQFCILKEYPYKLLLANNEPTIRMRNTLDEQFDYLISLIARNPEIGIKSLLFLFSRPQLFDFIMNNSDSICTLIRNQTSQLLMQVMEGEEEGANFIYYLCSTLRGREMLNKMWPFWQPVLQQKTSGFFAQITGEGPHQGKTALFHLCNNPDGRLILFDYFEFFEQVTFANIEMPFAGIVHRSAVIDYEKMFKGQELSENLPFCFNSKFKRHQEIPTTQESERQQLEENPNSFFSNTSEEKTGQPPSSLPSTWVASN